MACCQRSCLRLLQAFCLPARTPSIAQQLTRTVCGGLRGLRANALHGRFALTKGQAGIVTQGSNTLAHNVAHNLSTVV